MSGRGFDGARTLVDVLRIAASERPDSEAYVEYPDGVSGARKSITFGELESAAGAVASILGESGVGKGDVVALVLPSSIDYAVAYHAAMRIGAVTSGINPRLGLSERKAIFESLEPAVTISEGGLPVTAPTITRAEVAARIDEVIAGRRVGQAPAAVLDPGDPVAVVWTGGTTGVPKGALFDHTRLRAVAAGTDVLSADGDVRLSPLPFAHVGYMTRGWDELTRFVTTVITPTPWTAAEAIALIETEHVTVGQGVPTQWALVLASPALEEADVSSLRIAGTGASRVPPELVREMTERLGCPVVVRYTSTETSLGTGTKPGDPDGVVATTVGTPVPGVELEIVDGDGHEVARGDVGTVRLRSQAAMIGYVGRGTKIDAAKTAAVLDGAGWVTTGDLGYVGADGNLRLVGRTTEMLIRGGYNVYPSEVEAAIGALGSVARVSVVGAPDPVLGETVVAFVVPQPDTPPPSLEVLRAECRKTLADYKAPDRLVVTDELPLTPIGKVDTTALRHAAAKTRGARA